MIERVRLDDVRIERGMRMIVDALSLTVERGQALFLTGPNGAGKTTILRAIAGFLPLAGGSISFEGAPPDSERAEQCHVLTMADAVKTSLTAAENLRFWEAYLGGRQGAHLDAIAALGLAALSGVRVAYLSSGQRRRLGLARLLVADRPVWLLDEPTVALDNVAMDTLTVQIERHLAGGGIAIIATHAPLALAGAATLQVERFGNPQPADRS